MIRDGCNEFFLPFLPFLPFPHHLAGLLELIEGENSKDIEHRTNLCESNQFADRQFP